MSDPDAEAATFEADEQAGESATSEEDPVLQRIDLVAASRNPFLGISQMKVKAMPEALLNLTHLQFLYMAFNGLPELVDDFFSALPNVKWLDLRGNRLRSLPTVDLASHDFLEYLLLEDNCISHLPIELGYVKSLRGLALSGNPLDFPHAEVVAAGAAAVKAYLREVYAGRMEIENRLAEERDHLPEEADAAGSEVTTENLQEYDDQLLDEVVKREATTVSSAAADDQKDYRGKIFRQQKQKPKQQQQQQQQQEMLTTQTAPLHRQQAPQIRQRVAPKPVRASERHNQLVHRFPEPPGPGLVERRAAEERRNARRRETLARQEAVLQRRRDAEATRAWRDEARQLQATAMRERAARGGTPRAAGDSNTRIRAAPFNAGWDAEALLLPTHADLEQRRREEGSRGVPGEPKPAPMSAEEQARSEAERRRAEAEVARRVHAHAVELAERRRGGGGDQEGGLTAAQAVEAARRDVEMAMALQRELALRRAEFENRTLALRDPAAAAYSAAGRANRSAPKK